MFKALDKQYLIKILSFSDIASVKIFAFGICIALISLIQMPNAYSDKYANKSEIKNPLGREARTNSSVKPATEHQFKVVLNDVSIKSVDLSAVYFEIELLVDNELDKDLTIKKVEYSLDVQNAQIDGVINQSEKFVGKQSRSVVVTTGVPHAYSGSLVSALLSAKSTAIPYEITGIVFVEEFETPVKYEYSGIYNISEVLDSNK